MPEGQMRGRFGKYSVCGNTPSSPRWRSALLPGGEKRECAVGNMPNYFKLNHTDGLPLVAGNDQIADETRRRA